MKKILLVAVIQLFTISLVFSQTVIETEEVIEISKVKTLMVTDFTLDHYVESDTYKLVYRDYQYKMIDEYKYINLGNKESVLALKNVILDFLAKKEKEITIGLDMEPDSKLILKKVMGVYRPYIFRGGEFHGELQILNKAKMEKIFPSENFN